MQFPQRPRISPKVTLHRATTIACGAQSKGGGEQEHAGLTFVTIGQGTRRQFRAHRLLMMINGLGDELDESDGDFYEPGDEEDAMETPGSKANGAAQTRGIIGGADFPVGFQFYLLVSP